mgnify:CR=1 FL=1
MKYDISNPIYNELKKLNLIKDKNLIKISNKTRDKKISVFQDLKTKIIFLEKFTTHSHYYSLVKYGGSKIKTLKGVLNTPEIADDTRRAKQFKKFFVEKDVLDFGCGWGNFLSKLKSAKSLNGVELRKECLNSIKKKNNKINIETNINNFVKKFDIITMFHVLEHIPHQIETLKALRKKLKKNGKIIIEVPHSEDFLLEFDELTEFKYFTFWSEHLILHSYFSLKKILQMAGFKKIKINYFQRYGFDNHLGWFIKRKPGGHKFFRKYNSNSLNSNYVNNLIKQKKTDTLIAEAKN